MTTMTGATLEHTIGLEGLLAIRLRDGDVRLRGGDGEIVRIRDVNGHDLSDLFEIEPGAGSLSLKSGRGLEVVVGPRRMRRGHGRQTPDLEIDLPRRTTVVLEAASGDIDARDLVGDQRYRTASGDIQLRSVEGKLTIEAMSGDVDVTASGESDVTVRTVSGDIQLRAARLSTLRLSSTSGDIKVAGQLVGPGPYAIETVSGDGLLAPAGDVRIEMTSVTGDLTSDVGGDQVRERGRRSLEIGSGEPLVTFRSMSGDLHVGQPRAIDQTPAAPARSVARALQPTQPAPANGAIAAAYDDARLRILRSLERGEIDVAEAGRRLETLDAGDVAAPVAGSSPEGAAGGDAEGAAGGDDERQNP